MNTMVSPSNNKHEQDFPQFDARQTLSDYFEMRHDWLKQLSQNRQHREATQEVPDTLLECCQKVRNGVDCDNCTKQLFQFEKAFVVRGELESLLQRPYCLNTYVVLASVLLACHRQRNDLNALNTAIRLLDFIAQQYSRGDALDCELTQTCVKEELTAVECLLQ